MTEVARSSISAAILFPFSFFSFPLSHDCFFPFNTKTNQQKKLFGYFGSLALATVGSRSPFQGAEGYRERPGTGRDERPHDPQPVARTLRRANPRTRARRAPEPGVWLESAGPRPRSSARTARAAAASRRRSRPARRPGPGRRARGRGRGRGARLGRFPAPHRIPARSPPASTPPGAAVPSHTRASPPLLRLRLLLAEMTSDASSN